MANRQLTSKDFYSTPSQTGTVIAITIIIVVIVLLLLYLGIFVISKAPKACTAPPAVPTGVEAGFVNDATFRVLWPSVADTSKYTVYVGQTNTFTRVNAINITTTNRTYADIKGLLAGRTYYIMVSSSNNCGESANSAKISFVFVQA
jgi:hypothetical protein